MSVSPRSICTESDSSFEFFSGVEFRIENPLSVFKIDIGSNSKSSFVEKFDLLWGEFSV